MSYMHFSEHVGHELRALITQALCACGQPNLPGRSRCDVCAERHLDRLQELSRGELDDAR